jgi:hypothetical protein
MNIRRVGVVILLGAALLVAGPQGTCAQDADTAEIQRYTLTEAGLAKYSKATKALAALPGGRAGSCDDDSGENGQSIGQMVKRLEAAPGATAALQSSGMTSREYVVFSMSLFQNGMAAWALDQPSGKLPPGVSRANVDFVKKHDAQLKQLRGLSPDDACDDEAAVAEATE